MGHFDVVTYGALKSNLSDNIPISSVDYGVTGDGTTDDTANLNLALAAAEGGTLKIPYSATGYKITGTLLPKSNTVIEFENVTFNVPSSATELHTIEFNTVENVRLVGKVNIVSVNDKTRVETYVNDLSQTVAREGLGSNVHGIVVNENCSNIEIEDVYGENLEFIVAMWGSVGTTASTITNVNVNTIESLDCYQPYFIGYGDNCKVSKIFGTSTAIQMTTYDHIVYINHGCSNIEIELVSGTNNYVGTPTQAVSVRADSDRQSTSIFFGSISLSGYFSGLSCAGASVYCDKIVGNFSSVESKLLYVLSNGKLTVGKAILTGGFADYFIDCVGTESNLAEIYVNYAKNEASFIGATNARLVRLKYASRAIINNFEADFDRDVYPILLDSGNESLECDFNNANIKKTVTPTSPMLYATTGKVRFNGCEFSNISEYQCFADATTNATLELYNCRTTYITRIFYVSMTGQGRAFACVDLSTNRIFNEDKNIVIKKFEAFEYFDDFCYTAVNDTTMPYALLKGGDTSAIAPTIVPDEGRGLVRLRTGNTDGVLANDGSQWVYTVPILAEYGYVVFETSLRVITDANNVSVNVGFTDAKTLEEPFQIFGGNCTFTDAGDVVTNNSHGLENGDKVIFKTIVTTTGISINTQYFVVNKDANTFQVSLTNGGAAIVLTADGTGTYDAIRRTADDAVCFVYDYGATTKEWFACTVDSTVVDTGSINTSTALSTTQQKLRIEIDATSGTLITFFVDDVKVKTLSNQGVTPSVKLYATIVANATTTTGKIIDVDYVYVSHDR